MEDLKRGHAQKVFLYTTKFRLMEEGDYREKGKCTENGRGGPQLDTSKRMNKQEKRRERRGRNTVTCK